MATLNGTASDTLTLGATTVTGSVRTKVVGSDTSSIAISVNASRTTKRYVGLSGSSSLTIDGTGDLSPNHDVDLGSASGSISIGGTGRLRGSRYYSNARPGGIPFNTRAAAP